MNFETEINDPFFDKNYFINKNNIFNYKGYQDYLKDIRQHKSCFTENYINNLPLIQRDIVLVNHNNQINGASHSLYILANYLKNDNKSFIILDTELNLDLLKKYNLEPEDCLSYKSDSTILYWLCVKIQSDVIIFNSVNKAMSAVSKFLDKNKLILFSREIKKTYQKFFKLDPDYVITENISLSYDSKPKVQTPILPAFIVQKIEKEYNNDVLLDNFDSNKITIGMCGSRCSRKNFNLFLEVAQNLPQYNFLWIGGEDNKIINNVFLISDKIYPYSYYKLIDYFVLFSEFEPFGNVVLENLVVGNKVLSFKENVFYNFKHEKNKNHYLEFKGKINLQNAITHIKNCATVKKCFFVQKDILSAKQYVLDNFSKYSNCFLKRIYHKPLNNSFHLNKDKKIFVKCEDGFVNQLRLLLAGSFLIKENLIDSYQQEWTISNHNNINYLSFFEPIPQVNLTKLHENTDFIQTTTFQRLIEKYGNSSINWLDCFKQIVKEFKPSKEILEKVNFLTDKFNLKKALGLHIRRTCKDSILKFSHRNQLLTNEEILNMCSDYDTIYLATDNQETQNWFSHILSEKVIFYKKILSGKENSMEFYDRNKVCRYTDAEHSVLDFLLLKNCDKFIGTHESSFSLFLYYWRNNTKDFPLLGKL